MISAKYAFLMGVAPIAIVAQASAAAAQSLDERHAFDIAAQPVADALLAFSRQSNIQVVTASADVGAQQSRRVAGSMTGRAALDRLLTGTSLRWRQTAPGSIVVDSSQSGEAEAGGAAADSGSADAGATPEILIVGQRSLNADIRRSENDAQPYVIYDRSDIVDSGATTVEEFVRNNLSMSNPSNIGARQQGTSQISLRGLGPDETLILINGRRTTRPRFTSDAVQGDLNGIPLEAIERIEILPTSASGIYGGSATGGVINVITRRDYEGLTVAGSYGDTFSGGGANFRLDVTGGTNFSSGGTSLTFSATLERSDEILLSQRDFLSTARQRLLANNPAALPTGGVIPPLGATPNFRSLTGAPLFGPGTPNFGSVPTGYDGLAGRAGLVPGAGVYNLGISSSASNLGGGNFRLEPEIRRAAGTASISHDFSGGWRIYSEVYASRYSQVRPQGPTPFFTVLPGPGNPFGTFLFVTVPLEGIDEDRTVRITTVDASAGVIARLSSSWSANLEGGFGFARNEQIGGGRLFLPTLGPAVSSGAINIFRDTSLFPLDLSAYLGPPQDITPFDQHSRNLTLRVSGSLFDLPAGAVRLSMLGEVRTESFDESRVDTLVFPAVSQTVRSAYAETAIPVFGRAHRAPGFEELEVQLAARIDNYATSTAPSRQRTAPEVRFSAEQISINPTISVRYSPLPGLTMRGSFGTGFLPPSPGQLAQLSSTTVTTLSDPRRGGELVALPAGAVLSGGNPTLRPERSRSWALGLIIAPPDIPGLRLSADYVRIRKIDNIQAPGSIALLANEDLFPGRVTRASPAPGDPFAVGRIIALDASNINVARSALSALDFGLRYTRQAFSGDLTLEAVATWQTGFKRRLLPNLPNENRLGLSGDFTPLEFKGSASLTYQTERMRLRWNTRYLGGYRLDTQPNAAPPLNYALSNGGPDIDSQFYHDAFAAVTLPSLLSRVRSELQLSVTNVFNTAPRFDPTSSPPFFVSGFDDLRLRSFRVTLRLGI